MAGGLGEYFGLDPVLFRVLFAVAAFFGGFGVLAYAILWFALPETGDLSTSPVDRLGSWLKAHNIPLWLAGVMGVVAFWILVGGFGGWAFDGFFFPGAAVIGVVLLVVAFARRGSTSPPAPPAGRPAGPTGATDPTLVHGDPGTAPTVSLEKPLDPAGEQDTAGEPDTAGGPDTAERPMTSWFAEARERGRQRRRRSRPVFLGTLAALVVGLATVVVLDATIGVALPVYGWVVGAVVVAGLVVGLVAGRPSFGLTWLLVPVLVWTVAFAGTHTSLRDGAGDVVYRPTAASQLDDDYRLAFGRATLDLRDVYANAGTNGATDVPDRVFVRVAAGVARVVLPTDAEVTVEAHARFGTVIVDGVDDQARQGQFSAGWGNVTRVVAEGTDGPPLLVVLEVTDGAAVVDHVDG